MIGSHEMTFPGSRTRLPERNLDLIRATAVLLVLANHVAIALGERIHVLFPYWIGRIGVLIFFVHTSLVLMGSLERQGKTPGWVTRFCIRRAFRIYPLAIITVLLVVAFQIPARVPRPETVRVFVPPDTTTLVSNLALVQNLTKSHSLLIVLWSLPIEAQLYLGLPASFLVARHGVRWTVALIGALALVPTVVQADLLPGVWRLKQLAEFAPCFACGVLAYALLKHRGRLGRLPSWLAWIVIPTSAFIVRAIDPPQAYLPMEWGYTLLIALTIVFVAELPRSWTTRASAVVAKYSYGIYLMHIPVLWLGLVVCASAPLALRWTIVVAGLFAAPWAFYHLIEAPGIALGKRLVAGPTTRAATAPAP